MIVCFFNLRRSERAEHLRLETVGRQSEQPITAHSAGGFPKTPPDSDLFHQMNQEFKDLMVQIHSETFWETRSGLHDISFTSAGRFLQLMA